VNPVTTPQLRTRRGDGGRRPAAVRRPVQSATLFDAAPRQPAARAHPCAAPGSGETLDRIVVGRWERLTARAPSPCLVCGGTMEPVYGVHPTPIGGRCRDCGTTLS
jgi:hypothetical protein